MGLLGLFTRRGERKNVHRGRLWVWCLGVGSLVALLAADALWPDVRLVEHFSGDLSAQQVLAIFLAALICEYIDSSLGMGYGTTLTPLLLCAGFEPLQIVPCVLLSEFITGLTAGVMHHRDGNVDFCRDVAARRTALQLSALSVVGAGVAVAFALQVPKVWLNGIIAVVILSVGVTILATARRQMCYRPRHLVLLGTVAAFNKGLSGGGYGPLVTAGQVVSGLPPRHAVAITSVAESLTCLVGLTSYLALRGDLDWTLAAPLVLGAVLSVPVATLTVRRIPDTVLRASLGAVTSVLGVATLVRLFW